MGRMRDFTVLLQSFLHTLASILFINLFGVSKMPAQTEKMKIYYQIHYHALILRLT